MSQSVDNGPPVWEGPPFTILDYDTKEMLFAFKEAQSTISQFTNALENPKEAQSFFSVKIRLTDPDQDQTEYIWLSSITREGGIFRGRIDNDPQLASGVVAGEEISVSENEICDWMFVDNGRLVGGFTLRVLRRQATDEEREDFDEAVPFVVLDGVDLNDPIMQLLDAIGNKERNVCERLLQADPCLVNRIGTVCVESCLGDMVRENMCPLEYAVWLDDDKVADILLRHGAKPEVENELGNRPIHHAAAQGSIAMIRLLTKYGADINTRSKWGRTPIKMAGDNDRVEHVKVLIELGADAHVVEERTGQSVLHNIQSVKMAELFLDEDVELDLLDKKGGTPLHTAIINGFLDLAEYLVRQGAKLNIKNDEGLLPVDLARERLENEDLARFLKVIRGE